VPYVTRAAIRPMYEKLFPSYCEKVGKEVEVAGFDWALHPGGQAIIDGAKDVMGLADEQLRSSQEVYRTRGNSSSPTVLVVLDNLRQMGRGRDHVVAASFGPGVSIEMVMLKRCR
jgi:fungal type III polyketide synthase